MRTICALGPLKIMAKLVHKLITTIFLLHPPISVNGVSWMTLYTFNYEETPEIRMFVNNAIRSGSGSLM